MIKLVYFDYIVTVLLIFLFDEQEMNNDLSLPIDLSILDMITAKTEIRHLNLWIFRFLQVKQVMTKYWQNYFPVISMQCNHDWSMFFGKTDLYFCKVFFVCVSLLFFPLEYAWQLTVRRKRRQFCTTFLLTYFYPLKAALHVQLKSA